MHRPQVITMETALITGCHGNSSYICTFLPLVHYTLMSLHKEQNSCRLALPRYSMMTEEGIQKWPPKTTYTIAIRPCSYRNASYQKCSQKGALDHWTCEEWQVDGWVWKGCHLLVHSAVAEYKESLMTQCSS